MSSLPSFFLFSLLAQIQVPSPLPFITPIWPFRRKSAFPFFQKKVTALVSSLPLLPPAFFRKVF